MITLSVVIPSYNRGKYLLPLFNDVQYLTEKSSDIEFVKMVVLVTKSKSEIEFGVVAMRENELKYSCANLERIRKIGWQPHFSLRKALQLT